MPAVNPDFPNAGAGRTARSRLRIGALQIFSACALLSLCAPLWAAECAGNAAMQSVFAGSQLPGYCGATWQQDTGTRLCFNAGHADTASGKAFDQRSRQPIGSISKTAIGLAIAQLAVAGKLDLDAPLERYLSWKIRNPKFPEQPLTLRELATHRSSLRDREDAYRESYVPADQADTASLEAYLQSYTDPKGKRFSARNFVADAPGKRYEYSNMGAALAALVVEKVSAQGFDAYVQEHIMAPLHLGMSYQPKPGDTTLYQNQKPFPAYRLITYPDGGLRASCEDLRTYAAAIIHAHNGQPSALDAKAVQLMLTPQFDGKRPVGLPEKISNYGLFWEQRGANFGHSGSDPGVTGLLSIDLAQEIVRVQLTNVDISDSKKLQASFVALWDTLKAK
jgi:CubicO group peptidase (beta-lactamase class C family)